MLGDRPTQSGGLEAPGLRLRWWLCCRVEAAAQAFLQMSQQQVAVPLETLVQTFINAVTGAHVGPVSICLQIEP